MASGASINWDFEKEFLNDEERQIVDAVELAKDWGMEIPKELLQRYNQITTKAGCKICIKET